jgi:hypothetical protein
LFFLSFACLYDIHFTRLFLSFRFRSFHSVCFAHLLLPSVFPPGVSNCPGLWMGSEERNGTNGWLVCRLFSLFAIVIAYVCNLKLAVPGSLLSSATVEDIVSETQLVNVSPIEPLHLLCLMPPGLKAPHNFSLTSVIFAVCARAQHVVGLQFSASLVSFLTCCTFQEGNT